MNKKNDLTKITEFANETFVARSHNKRIIIEKLNEEVCEVTFVRILTKEEQEIFADAENTSQNYVVRKKVFVTKNIFSNVTLENLKILLNVRFEALNNGKN